MQRLLETALTLVAYFVARFIRNLASAADTVRERVAELEHERSRAVVHDLLALLRLDRFAAARVQERAQMIAQAQAKHGQMRSYVDGAGPTRNLDECIAAALRLRPSLQIRCATEAGTGLRLDEDVLEQLGQALDTALSNVEQHAPGAVVTLSVHSEQGIGTRVSLTVPAQQT